MTSATLLSSTCQMTNLGPAQLPITLPPVLNPSSSSATPSTSSASPSNPPPCATTPSNPVAPNAPQSAPLFNTECLPSPPNGLPSPSKLLSSPTLSPTQTTPPPLPHLLRSQTPSALRKRPRAFQRPPSLIIPPRPPTSLPTCFYPYSSPPNENTEGLDSNNNTDLPSLSPEHVGVWHHDTRAAAASRKGRRRRINEDRVFARPDLGIFGVCDGHGADSFSQTYPPLPHQVPAHKVAELLPPLLANGCCFEDAFRSVDHQVCAMFPPRSFIGTTVTVAMVRRGVDLRVAHVGDTRAMLIDADGLSHTLTQDHSPSRPDESMRIDNAGGHVLRGRVNGVLAVSRAVGDRALKAVVPAIPDVVEHRLRENDQLLVVGSDGLWDIMSDMEVMKIIKSQPLARGSCAVPADLDAVAVALVDEAIARGSRDDTSVVLVDLRRNP